MEQNSENISSNILPEQKFVHPNSANTVLYSNGFIGGQSTVDMYLIGMLNGSPNFTINMSYTTAKALQAIVNDIINNYEFKMGEPILSLEEISKKLLNK